MAAQALHGLRSALLRHDEGHDSDNSILAQETGCKTRAGRGAGGSQGRRATTARFLPFPGSAPLFRTWRPAAAGDALPVRQRRGRSSPRPPAISASTSRRRSRKASVTGASVRSVSVMMPYSVLHLGAVEVQGDEIAGREIRREHRGRRREQRVAAAGDAARERQRVHVDRGHEHPARRVETAGTAAHCRRRPLRTRQDRRRHRVAEDIVPGQVAPAGERMSRAAGDVDPVLRQRLEAQPWRVRDRPVVADADVELPRQYAPDDLVGVGAQHLDLEVRVPIEQAPDRIGDRYLGGVRGRRRCTACRFPVPPAAGSRAGVRPRRRPVPRRVATGVRHRPSVARRSSTDRTGARRGPSPAPRCCARATAASDAAPRRRGRNSDSGQGLARAATGATRTCAHRIRSVRQTNGALCRPWRPLPPPSACRRYRRFDAGRMADFAPCRRRHDQPERLQPRRAVRFAGGGRSSCSPS